MADFSLFLQATQWGYAHRQQLQDDRGGDVGHDPQREQTESREAPAREEVEEAEDVGAAEVALDFLHPLDVDARRRYVCTEAVQRQHRRREGEILANVGDAGSVRNSPVHYGSQAWHEPPVASIF